MEKTINILLSIIEQKLRIFLIPQSISRSRMFCVRAFYSLELIQFPLTADPSAPLAAGPPHEELAVTAPRELVAKLLALHLQFPKEHFVLW